jgi:hypothetical protein
MDATDKKLEGAIEPTVSQNVGGPICYLGKCHEVKAATLLAHRLGPLTAQRKLPIVNSLRR